MAGGNFKIQNKLRPGAYINFKTKYKPTGIAGKRGVMTMPVMMSWGSEITILTSEELLNGDSLSKIGYTVFDGEAQVFREALKNCYKAIIYRLDTGGSKATATIGTLTITAKYAGKLGNEIAISVVANDSKFDVITTFKGLEKDRQTVLAVSDLVANDYVVFSGTANVIANAGEKLTGGTDGTVNTENYAKYLKAIQSYNWNTMGIPQDSSSVNASIITFIKNLRENYGKKVQAVLYNVDADYEGIISVNQGYKTADEIISPTTFVAYIAGLTAGASVDTSNTYHVINDAINIIYPSGVAPYTEDEIEEMLKKGKMILSTRRDGAIVIEQDINTLHTFTSNKGYEFSKNRVLRVLDEINNSIALIFEKNYIGKVSNDSNGRNVFKGEIINMLNNLQNISAIQNFDPSTDIFVRIGDNIDSVVVDLAIQPVDAMEKLYMTVLVG